jgi:hypothetical protein
MPPRYHYVRTVLEDPDHPGELLLDLGHDLCQIMGWHVGDTLHWIDNGDGSWTLKKAIDTDNKSTI